MTTRKPTATGAAAAPESAAAARRPTGGHVAVPSGWVLTALTGGFLTFDGVTHLLKATAVVDASQALGFNPDLMPLIGAVELLCLLLWLVPRTAVLGAVLLTGYLGGAVAAQLRIDAPVASTTLFPVYVGMLVWVALLLRDHRLGALLLRPAGAATRTTAR